MTGTLSDRMREQPMSAVVAEPYVEREIASAGESQASPAESSITASVTKALQLLDVFRDGSAVLGVSEISRLAGVPKSTAFRLLAYLQSAGFVERAGKGYLLGRRLFELGNSVQMCRQGGLREIVIPHLSELFVATGKSVQLGVLEGTDVIYLDKIVARDSVKLPTQVGSRMPASCTAIGKAMLAYSGRPVIGAVLESGLERRTPYSIADPARFLAELRRINHDAVAFDREEVQVGLVCVAAPILHEGRAIGAISVSGRATQFNSLAISTQVRATAIAISRSYAGEL